MKDIKQRQTMKAILARKSGVNTDVGDESLPFRSYGVRVLP